MDVLACIVRPGLETARPRAKMNGRGSQTAVHKGEQSLETDAADGDSPLPSINLFGWPIEPRCKILTQYGTFTKFVAVTIASAMHFPVLSVHGRAHT